MASRILHPVCGDNVVLGDDVAVGVPLRLVLIFMAVHMVQVPKLPSRGHKNQSDSWRVSTVLL